MEKCDQKFLELYLNSIAQVDLKNKIICDNKGYILFTSKNINDKYKVGNKLELIRLPNKIDRELGYNPLTGNLLMVTYNLDEKQVTNECHTPIKEKRNSYSLEKCKQKLSTIYDYASSDIKYLALYISSYLTIFKGYVKVNSKNNSLTIGSKSLKEFKYSKDIVSPLTGKVLGTINYI